MLSTNTGFAYGFVGPSDAMTESTKRILRFLLRSVVTAGLLWLIFRRIDLGGLAQAIGRAQWRYVLLSWAIGVLAHWVRAVRLGFILERLGCRLASWKIFSASAVATIYGLVLPGIVSVGVKWYILRSFTGRAAQALSAMVYNQASELLVRLLLSLVLVAATNPMGLWWIPVLCLSVAVVVMVGSLLLLHPQTSTGLVRISNSILRPFPTFLRDGARRTIESSQVFASPGPGFHLGMAAINVGSTLISAVLYWRIVVPSNEV